MTIRNPRKLVSLENLKFGAVFQKENDYYIKTDAKSIIADNKKNCTCINLENGHWTCFSGDEFVYFCDAELVI